MGQSGRCGSDITKFCWIRSTVVAKSSATRGNDFGTLALVLPDAVRCADGSANCRQHDVVSTMSSPVEMCSVQRGLNAWCHQMA